MVVLSKKEITWFICDTIYGIFLKIQEWISFAVIICVCTLILIIYIPFKNIQYYIFGICDNRYNPYIPNTSPIHFRCRKTHKRIKGSMAG